MNIEPSWITAFAIIALPILGFILGARWMRYRHELRKTQNASAAPAAADALDALDSVHAQVEELAERQDFAERLLLERRHKEQQRSPDATTPV